MPARIRTLSLRVGAASCSQAVRHVAEPRCRPLTYTRFLRHDKRPDGVTIPVLRLDKPMFYRLKLPGHLGACFLPTDLAVLWKDPNPLKVFVQVLGIGMTYRSEPC